MVMTMTMISCWNNHKTKVAEFEPVFQHSTTPSQQSIISTNPLLRF